MSDRIVAAGCGRRVEEELCIFGPELCGELKEDLGVDCHCESGDCLGLPAWKSWGKRYRTWVCGREKGLQDAEAESTDSIGYSKAGIITGMDCNAR